jgi:hypothetical protein
MIHLAKLERLNYRLRDVMMIQRKDAACAVPLFSGLSTIRKEFADRVPASQIPGVCPLVRVSGANQQIQRNRSNPEEKLIKTTGISKGEARSKAKRRRANHQGDEK